MLQCQALVELLQKNQVYGWKKNTNVEIKKVVSKYENYKGEGQKETWFKGCWIQCFNQGADFYHWAYRRVWRNQHWASRMEIMHKFKKWKTEATWRIGEGW